MKIRHCPTLQMLGDFFTKPLQGSLFRVFRDVLLGYKHTSALAQYPGTPVEERVGIVQPEYRDTAPQHDRQTKSNSHSQMSWADVTRTKKTTDVSCASGRTSDVSRKAPGRNKHVVSRELILSKQSSE